MDPDLGACSSWSSWTWSTAMAARRDTLPSGGCRVGWRDLPRKVKKKLRRLCLTTNATEQHWRALPLCQASSSRESTRRDARSCLVKQRLAREAPSGHGRLGSVSLPRLLTTLHSSRAGFASTPERRCNGLRLLQDQSALVPKLMGSSRGLRHALATPIPTPAHRSLYALRTHTPTYLCV